MRRWKQMSLYIFAIRFFDVGVGIGVSCLIVCVTPLPRNAYCNHNKQPVVLEKRKTDQEFIWKMRRRKRRLPVSYQYPKNIPNSNRIHRCLAEGLISPIISTVVMLHNGTALTDRETACRQHWVPASGKIINNNITQWLGQKWPRIMRRC